jgi:hypothetical protein
MRFGVFVVGFAACAEIEPAFDFEPLVTVVEDGNERRVIGPGYEMRFHGGGAQELHFPDSLVISQDGARIETLHVEEPTCGLERQVGLALFPALVATSDTDATVLDSEIITNDDGPFVAQINTSFRVQYECPSTQEFTGKSTFTFFPNGRIVRHDFDVQAIANGSLTSTPGTGIPCGCDAAFDASFFFTSFWAFDPTGRNVDSSNADITNPDVDQMGACTIYDTHAIGVQYAPVTSRVGPNSNADAHVHDMQTGLMVDSSEEEIFSAIQIVGGDELPNSQCTQILQGLSAPSIQAGEAPIATPNQDGIYDDPLQPRSDGEPFDITVIGDSIVPPGWAFATDVGTDIVKITRDPPTENSTEPVAHIQRLDENHFIFVFTDSLGPGVTITIEPQ